MLIGLRGPNNLFGDSGLKILSNNDLYWTVDCFIQLRHHSFYVTETANFSSIELGVIVTHHPFHVSNLTC